MRRGTTKPDWDRLYEIAISQDAHFTTRQAAATGYSPQLLAKYLKNGRIRRLRRGIYRIVHCPVSEHEDLAVFWLWSDLAGVFSHETALALHGFSDVLSASVHMTLPAIWKQRRVRVPRGLVLHHADVGEDERVWVGAVPVTSARRTLIDCAIESVAPDLVRDAFADAVQRGLVTRESVPEVLDYLTRHFSTSRSRSGPRR